MSLTESVLSDELISEYYRHVTKPGQSCMLPQRMDLAVQDQENDQECSKEFKTIVGCIYECLKSPNCKDTRFSFSSSFLKENLEFVAKEASRRGLGAFFCEGNLGNHVLWVSKEDSPDMSFIQLAPASEKLINVLLGKSKYIQDDHHGFTMLDSGSRSKLQINRQCKVPKPKSRKGYSSEEHRKPLPIFKYRDEISKSIMTNKITLIKGPPGCGKSTQVPQFILDDASKENRRVQILATMPQRVSAIHVAEAVALERGEKIGSSVGYQVRLESRVSPCDTVLMLCTNDILLRSLILPDYAILKNISHLIIDDINERDQCIDFLLTCIRDLLPSFPHLRVILMGADMNLDIFSAFFHPLLCKSTILVTKPNFPVKVYFLDDILAMPSYPKADYYSPKILSISLLDTNFNCKACDNDRSPKCPRLKEEFLVNEKYIDHLMEKVFKCACKASASKLISLVASENVSASYRHSETNVPIITCFAVNEFLEEVQQMIEMGADIELTSTKEEEDCLEVMKFTARDFAMKFKNMSVVDCLTKHQCESSQKSKSLEPQNITENSQSVHNSFSAHVINLMYNVHREEDISGVILVFMKDYHEIIEVMNTFNNSAILNKNEFNIFVVHPEMQYNDQEGVYRSTPEGVRKVIFTTSIAETSLTFSNVCFVIDGGRNTRRLWSEKDDDDDVEWISKSSAKQRKSLAGYYRPGKCYRLYSEEEYKSFDETITPNILLSSLLHLCLMCRSLIRAETQISQFFYQVPSPPDPLKVNTSIKILQVMEAFDNHANLTDLGNHIIDYGVEPQLAKALFYGVVLKCLDPVLTIVATLHHGDPFLNSNANLCSQSIEYKQILGKEQQSDHYAYVRLFQEWEKETFAKKGTNFCTRKGLRVSTFEKICTSRTMLLGQLRASGFVKNDIRDLNQNSKIWVVVKAVLTAARFPNIAQVDRLLERITLLGSDNEVGMHSSTIIAACDIIDLKSDWIVFDELLSTHTHEQIKGCTVVTPICVALFGSLFSSTSSSKKVTDEDNSKITSALQIGDGMILHGTASSVERILQLRMRLKLLIEKILRNPHGVTSNVDADLVKTIADVLHQEDNKIGLENADVSQWPKFVGANMMTAPQVGT